MSHSIGTPRPDGPDRRTAAATHRDQSTKLSGTRGHGTTSPNGEETDYGLTYALNFHKGLPHDVNGFPRQQDYQDMVAMLVDGHHGGIETLPVRRNRQSAQTPENPPRYSTNTQGLNEYRGLVSPFTGHVYDLQGADAGDLGMSPAPRLDSDELAAEMAEVYAMALLRDVPFTQIEDGTSPTVAAVVDALNDMTWFGGGGGTPGPLTKAEQRRFATRHPVTNARDLFRGSTPGSVAGPWLSQFLLIGTSTEGKTIQPTTTNPPSPNYRGTRLPFGREDGFVQFGPQIIDQRSIVAVPGVDYMTNWASWLDAQNGVGFGGQDVCARFRRYLSTPRDVASYVHIDQLYQAYLVACLIMLAEQFPVDRGMPETASRTREAFASFGGPHVLSLVTEVATRALKAVWRQKWLHHRRARPEAVAALLTLHANHPDQIPDGELNGALSTLLSKIPTPLLDAVAAHNTEQNASTPYTLDGSVQPALPAIADERNYLLPMAFPEGSPTHPSYGAGHATVAGACVTVLKAFFDMFNEDGITERAWPFPALVANPAAGRPAEGGELVPDPNADPNADPLTVQGELNKLAANISIGRNMAGVHYYTDYYESARLGERIAVAILEEQASLYDEAVTMRFTSFDGDDVHVVGDNGATHLRVYAKGVEIPSEQWYGRYAS